jgi:hypothetical protein
MIMASTSYQRVRVGDRFAVTCMDRQAVTGEHIVTVRRVKRLFCGCDELAVDRPGTGDAFPTMALLPTGCYHDDVVDFDAARGRAVEIDAATH